MALRHVALVLMATAMSPVQGSTPPDAATVFFLRDSGADVVVDSIGLADGEMKVLAQEALAVILPFGTTGMSGDVVQKAQRTGRIAVLRRGDEIRTTIRRPDGQQRDLPAVTLADLAAVDIRVNVTGGSGLRKAYLIRGYRVDAVMHGAGGEVSGFLGQAVLPQLRIGSMDFSSARVNVVKSFPAFGREVVGVLGLDLLGRAAVASLELSGAPSIHLSPKPLPEDPAGHAVPFSVVARHLFLDATVDGIAVRLLFDTGARRTLIGPDVARRAGLRVDAGHVWEVRGLDGHRLELPSGVAARVTFGSLELADQRIYVGELPALRAMGLHATGGLLGMDVVARFSRVDVDFAAGVIRFHPL